MKRLFFFLIAGAFAWQAASLAADAQLVQVAPGYVKAPFVRVWSGPDGSSHVRAPFVDVHSGPMYQNVHGGPTPDDVAQMNWQSLAQTIRQWRQRLDADLNNFPSGDFWRTTLRTVEIGELVASDRDGPPQEDVRQRLRTIFDVQESAAKPQVNSVAGLLSFQVLHAALGEYTTPPLQRGRRQLAGAAHDLYRALGRYETGPGWREYLMLAPGMPLAEDQLQGADSRHSIDEMERALAAYDSVDQNEQYRVIARLPSFRSTHDFLALYLRDLRSPPTSPPEELPQPRAD